MKDKVCLVTGVGDGTGAAIARRFTKAGYRVAMLARNADRLAKLEKELTGSKAFAFDLADLDRLVEVCRRVETEMGAPHMVVHNAVRATFEPFMVADPEDLERNFRVNTTTLLYMARELAPAMVSRGSGAIVVTGNTAALRGVPNFAVFAPTKEAQRILAQSLARDLGPKGVHVAYVTIDAAIDTLWTRPLSIPTNLMTSSANQTRSRKRYCTSLTKTDRHGLSALNSGHSERNGDLFQRLALDALHRLTAVYGLRRSSSAHRCRKWVGGTLSAAVGSFRSVQMGNVG